MVERRIVTQLPCKDATAEILGGGSPGGTLVRISCYEQCPSKTVLLRPEESIASEVVKTCPRLDGFAYKGWRW